MPQDRSENLGSVSLPRQALSATTSFLSMAWAQAAELPLAI